MSAAQSAPFSVDQALANIHTMTTPIIRGGKSSEPPKECMDMDMGMIPPMPSMQRSTTDSFLPSAMMSDAWLGDSRSAAEPSRPKDLALHRPMNRRFSNPEQEKSYAVRLSIRRSLDLTGEAIENYSQSTRTIGSSYMPNKNVQESNEVQFDPDDADELKAAVVMEHLIRAADISPLMQGWQQMEKWSSRLFFELKSSHDDGRGEDPQNNWFENQITFLESYILPLARRLDDMGVFGESTGPMFGRIVEQNRERWVSDGRAATAQVVQEWQMSKGEKHRLSIGF